jgi:hypothetical protein
MAEEPAFGLDANWVRLALEAEKLPSADWPEMIDKVKILHRCSTEAMAARRPRG